MKICQPFTILRRPFLSFGLTVFAFAWPFSLVQGQSEYCTNANALAETVLTQFTDACGADLSTCGASTCDADCLYGSDSAATGCVDGCAYTSGDYTVGRSTSASYATFFLVDLGTTVPLINVGFTHTFTAGAVGQFIYNYEGVVSGGVVAPALGGVCTFSFNGVACGCEQFYCDAENTVAANRIDCSAVEGGAVIDICTGVTYSDSLTLLEILYAVPFAVCQGNALDGTTTPPTTSSSVPPAAATVAPDVSPTSATVPTANEGDGNDISTMTPAMAPIPTATVPSADVPKATIPTAVSQTTGPTTGIAPNTEVAPSTGVAPSTPGTGAGTVPGTGSVPGNGTIPGTVPGFVVPNTTSDRGASSASSLAFRFSILLFGTVFVINIF